MTMHRKSMLFAAIRANDIDALESVLSTERKRLRADGTDFHLLCKSIEYNRKDIAALLLDHGCRPNLPSYNGDTPLHLAVARRNWSSLVRRLLERGAKVDQPNRWNETALHLAFDSSADDRLVKTLLKAHLKRSTANVTNDAGLSFLHIACATNDLESVRRLVEAGADVNAQVKVDSNSPYVGSTPLHMAVEFSRRVIIEYLLSEGANVYAADNEGTTPIHLALELGETDIIELLFEIDNERLNSVNKYGLSHFMAACACSDSYFAADFLVDKFDGDELLSVNEVVGGGDNYALKGYTALHFAAIFGRVETTEYLLAEGANCCAATREKITPMELAAANGHEDVVDVIKNHCQGYNWFHE